jgi:hypothetical protein
MRTLRVDTEISDIPQVNYQAIKSAVQSGNLSFIQEQIKSGLSLIEIMNLGKKRPGDGETALYLAASLGHDEIVRFVIEEAYKGLNSREESRVELVHHLTLLNEQRRNVLHAAASCKAKKDNSIIIRLLCHAASSLANEFKQLNSYSQKKDEYNGLTALHHAVLQEECSLPNIQALVDSGADSIQSNLNETPIDLVKKRYANTPEIYLPVLTFLVEKTSAGRHFFYTNLHSGSLDSFDAEIKSDVKEKNAIITKVLTIDMFIDRGHEPKNQLMALGTLMGILKSEADKKVADGLPTTQKNQALSLYVSTLKNINLYPSWKSSQDKNTDELNISIYDNLVKTINIPMEVKDERSINHIINGTICLWLNENILNHAAPEIKQKVLIQASSHFYQLITHYPQYALTGLRKLNKQELCQNNPDLEFMFARRLLEAVARLEVKKIPQHTCTSRLWKSTTQANNIRNFYSTQINQVSTLSGLLQTIKSSPFNKDIKSTLKAELQRNGFTLTSPAPISEVNIESRQKFHKRI